MTAIHETHKMGIMSCSSYVIGSIIGSGIFITAGDVAVQANSVGLTLVLWFVCALFSFLGAIVYIELATAITEPGADYAYAMHVGWKAMAFTFMLVSVCITFPASAAVQSITFGQYVKQFVTDLTSSTVTSNTDIDWTVFTLALLLLAATTFLNFFALDKAAAPFQILVTICKVGAILFIIAIGFYHLIFLNEKSNFKDAFAGSNWNVGSITMGIYGGLWSYAGWDILNYGTPEIKHPHRTMPLSLLFGLSIVCAAYLLVNTSFFTVLSLQQVQNSTAIGFEFAEATMGGGLAKVIPAMIAVLVMGTLNSNIFCGSRVMHAAAREGHLPSFLSAISQSSSPRPAILLQSLISVVMCFIPTAKLVNGVTFVMWAQKAVTAAALLYIRYKNIPVKSDVIRVPIILTWILLICSVALVLIPFITDLDITLFGCGVILLALLLYFVAVRFSLCSCGGYYKRISDATSTVVCKLLNVEVDMNKEASKEEREELNSEDERQLRL